MDNATSPSSPEALRGKIKNTLQATNFTSELEASHRSARPRLPSHVINFLRATVVAVMVPFDHFRNCQYSQASRMIAALHVC